MLNQLSHQGAPKLPTIDFGSGHDLTVCGFELCAEGMETASDSLSSSLSTPPLFYNKYVTLKKKRCCLKANYMPQRHCANWWRNRCE